MSGVEKYIRELHQAGITVRHLINAASTDISLVKTEREDIVWELTRLGSQISDTVAALLMVGRNEDGV